MSEEEVHDEPSPVEGRLIDAHCLLLDTPESRDIVYNHTAFCQTSLPYRNPGSVTRILRRNGQISVAFNAGYLMNSSGDGCLMGLPYGPRARLVLIHLMTQAVLTKSPRVELENSLTGFAKKLGLASSGRNIRTLREQMQRMAACSVQIMLHSSQEQFQAHILENLQLFMPKEPNQRVLWPSYVELNAKFFESLLKHSVPLDPRALAALKHSSAALDCYQWLAQRLHRVRNPTLVPWTSLFEQLGGTSKTVRSWKQSFLGKKGRAGVLPQVLMVYPAAKEAIEISGRGLILSQAEPPIPRWGKVQRGRYLT